MLASVMQMQLLPAVLALAAFLVAILLTLYIVRMLFGRRIRVSGGRNRPKRLDIVDAFDLDRERQLVIVRRDNVEHLLLIGGPSDVLIEASIERPAGAQVETKPEGRPAAPGVTPSWPAPPQPAEEAEETPVAAREPAPRIPSPAPGPQPSVADGLRRRFPEPARPAPRPPEPPRAPGAPPAPGVRPPAPPAPGGRLGTPGPQQPQQWDAPGAPPVPGPRPDAPPRPGPAAPALGQRPAAPPRPAAPGLAPRPPRPNAPPPAQPAGPPPAENAPPPQDASPSRPTRESLESLESLEAEMARLLGRPEGQ